jgi:hypothetical protein
MTSIACFFLLSMLLHQKLSPDAVARTETGPSELLRIPVVPCKTETRFEIQLGCVGFDILNFYFSYFVAYVMLTSGLFYLFHGTVVEYPAVPRPHLMLFA